MKIIPFNEALAFLAAASTIEVADVPCTVIYANVYTEDDADYFLEIEADNGDGRVFTWAFSESANQQVKVEGTDMTLIADSDDFNDSGPLTLRLLVPLHFEPVREVTCVYCGKVYPDGTPTYQNELLTAHIKVCDQHPMRAVEQSCKEMSERLNSVREFADKLIGTRYQAATVRRMLLRRLGYDESGKPIPKDYVDPT